jgi:hypothetical protein
MIRIRIQGFDDQKLKNIDSWKKNNFLISIKTTIYLYLVMGKKSGSESGMNNPDHISESLETFFWVSLVRIRDGKNSDTG